jgi:predicted Zn-dependent protease
VHGESRSGKQDFTLMLEAEEIRKGQQAAVEISKAYNPYDDLPTLQKYVNEIGQKLVESHRPELDYHFTVVDSPQVNAFTLPRGHIYITRGILAYLNSEAELAAVLAHEIGNVTARAQCASIQRRYSIGRPPATSLSLMLNKDYL